MLCHLQKRTTILTVARPEPSALSGQRAVVAWIVEWVRHGCMHWATENGYMLSGLGRKVM